MKILLLLVLKCLLYLKITGDHIYQSEIQAISSEKIPLHQNNLVEYSPQCIRVKRDSPIRNPSIFDPSEPPRSPRRKRAVLRKKNQIFFRRHKKKMERKSKIRKSLFRRGKFTTSTPYRNNMKKYVRGKGKIVRPPGLKYRKRYRFNQFKKTQDVALGMGGGGMAQFKKSAPKKRPPIHVRDYERGRRTRKAFRGRVGERKSSDDDRRRAIVEDRANQRRARNAAKARNTGQKSKEYYDESDDYVEDSLPKQTRARKSQGAFGKTTKWKKIVTPLKIKDSNFEYSSEDNTLLLSDEHQLTDISSEIEAQRSELSDERPKHRKNASSSEYDQYSFAEDDSAIVEGEIVSSKEASEQRVSFPRKSTILGPIKYAQYDINKLDASMERVFKKKKAKNKIEAKAGKDDPWDNAEEAYNDETSYDESSEKKDEKQKGKKSKTQVKKAQGKSKLSQKNQRKPKSGKTKAKSETDHEEHSYDESEEYDDAEFEKYDDDESEEYDEDGSQEYDEDGSEEYDEDGSEEYDEDGSEEYDEGSEEYEDEDYDDKSTSKESQVSYEDVEATSLEDETSSMKNKTGSVNDEANSEKKPSKGKGSNETEEYGSEYESDEYSAYVETPTPKRRIPTWKITHHSTLEKFYEEYTDSEDKTKSKPDSKTKKAPKGLPGKTTSKVKHSSKKAHEKSTYESEEYYSEEHSDSKSSHEDKNQQNKTGKFEKNFKTKSEVEKNQDASEFSSHYYDSSEYSDSKPPKKVSKSQKVNPSGKSKINPKLKSDRKENQISSKSSSYYDDSSEYTDSESQKKDSTKFVSKSQKTTLSGKMSSKTDMTPKSDSKEIQLSSEFSSHYYDSSESSDLSSNENYPEKKASKTQPPKSDKKSKTTSLRKTSPKIASTLSRKIPPKPATTPRKKSKTTSVKAKSALKKNKATSEFSSETSSDQSTREKDSLPSKKISKISTDLSYDSDYSDESDNPNPILIKITQQDMKSSTKKFARPQKFGSNKKSKSKKNQPTPMFETNEYSEDSDEGEDSRVIKSFGLDEDYRKKRLNFSTAEQLEIIRYAKSYKLPPVEIMNTKIQGLDIVRSEHERKYDLSLTESKAEPPNYLSYDNVSDYSIDPKERRELKSFGLGDFSVPTSIEFTAEKEISGKGNKKKKKLTKTTSKTSVKTTKKKGKAKKSIETYESDYDSEVTSYEESSDDTTQTKKGSLKTISSNKKDIKLTSEKHHETSDESKDLDSEIISKHESLRSSNDENESTKGLSGKKTTLTTKRPKKGFTTLPTTTKGFDSEEALKKISSKAAAITKKHGIVYNAKKKAYELIRVDSTKPRENTGSSTLSNVVDPVSTDMVKNSTEIPIPTGKTLRRRVVRRRTTSEGHSDMPESISETKTTRRRSRKTTPPGS